MTEGRVYNFAPGPSILPEDVLIKARSEIMNYHGSGMSVMEMSHRGSAFSEIFSHTKEGMRDILSIPDNYEILFLQGGATLQFASIPMNLIQGRTADYAVTGNFSGKAAEEAKKYGRVNLVCNTGDTGHDRIPSQSELLISKDAEYFYYCANNTIYGTEWHYLPMAKAPLICDMSSDILSSKLDVSKYGLIYAGAQKNISPAGLTVVILNKALVGKALPITPQVLNYDVLIKNDSMLNTPPCWCIYMLSLNVDWIKAQGGLCAMDELRKARAKLIYDVLDDSDFYIPHARPDSRSFMNVTFRTPSEELDAEFVKEASVRGLISLKGHRITGGIRASLYNAMPLEGAVALAEFMKKFEVEHCV